MGMKRKPPSWRALPMNSSPPILGMLISVMIRSGLAPPWSWASASAPSLAAITVKPAISSVFVRLISMVLESSTIMIVLAMVLPFYCGKADASQLVNSASRGQAGRHQHLQAGRVDMGAGRQVQRAARMALHPFEQLLGLLDADQIAQHGQLFVIHDVHHSNSLGSSTIKTEPSPSKAQPA